MRGMTEKERREANWNNYFSKGFGWAEKDYPEKDRDINTLGIKHVGFRFNEDSTVVTLHFYGERFYYIWDRQKWNYTGRAIPANIISGGTE